MNEDILGRAIASSGILGGTTNAFGGQFAPSKFKKVISPRFLTQLPL